MKDLIRLYREPAVVDALGASSASVSLPMPDAKASEPPPAATPPSSFAIPEEFKDRPYLKGIDSSEKVFKMLDGAQELIGKRPAGIPAADAPPEEWEKFYEAAGRPKTAAEYAFDGADKADPKFLPKVQGAMHKAGLNASQAKIVYSEVSSALAEIAREQGVDLEKQNTDFEALANKSFGVNRDKVMATSRSLLDQYTPPDMKGELGKLSNEALIIMAGVLNNVNAKYIKQDGPPGGGPTSTGLTASDISAKARELMLTDAYKNPFHAQHESTKKQVNDLYNGLRK